MAFLNCFPWACLAGTECLSVVMVHLLPKFEMSALMASLTPHHCKMALTHATSTENFPGCTSKGYERKGAP